MANDGVLSSAFSAAAPASILPELLRRGDLEAELARWCEQVQRRWPQLGAPDPAFLAFVAQKLPANEEPAPELASLHWEELWLAFGCTLGRTAAIAAFEAEYFPRVQAELARMGLLERADEVKQVLRQLLFVSGPEREAVIRRYSGRRPVWPWLKVIALREALRLKEAPSRQVDPDDSRLISAFTAADPELAPLRQEFVGAFRQAFADAARALEERERNLLRYHFVDGLNIDEIGALYRVHRTTAFRWIVKAREELAKQTKALVMARMEVGASELDSLMRYFFSQLNVSLRTALGGG